MPAKNFHQNIAILVRWKSKHRRQNFLQRNFARAGQNESRRSLLQKKFLQRRQLVQDRFLDSGRQFAEKSLELFDDVKKQETGSFRFRICRFHFAIFTLSFCST